MRDYRDISSGVISRLGLGIEWKGLVERYVLYSMSVWGRGVRDLVGVRVEEDFDIRMDLRGYKRFAYCSGFYKLAMHRAVGNDKWVIYRNLVGRGIMEDMRKRYERKRDSGYYHSKMKGVRKNRRVLK